jgi:SAM-dependent methyltransferase
MGASRKNEWFDDDALWRDTYPFMFPETRFADTPGEAAELLALVKPAGKAVLDLCCGPGRYAVALAERGFSVTGVDRTAFLLGKARARAKAAGVRVEWVRSDMRDFVRPEAFDLALSMYTSFGYFDNKDEDTGVLRNVLASLRPGGTLVIQTMGKERLAKIFLATTSQRLPDGSQLIQHHETFDDWTRVRNEWVLIRKGRARTFRFHHTVYSGQELKERMLEAGFADVKLYGSLGGDAYDSNARWLVAVGRKRGSASRAAGVKRSGRRGRA